VTTGEKTTLLVPAVTGPQVEAIEDAPHNREETMDIIMAK
jgi:hypothetical protein